MKWCIPNIGPVVLILDAPPGEESQAKKDMIEVLDRAAGVVSLPSDFARFRVLLRDHIKLEAKLLAQR